MKKFKIIISIICLTGLLAINSCKKEETKQQNNQPQFIKNFGVSVERDFLIEVIDEDGSHLSNANIQIGDFTGRTDVNGILLKKSARVYEKFAFIKASKSGYISGGRSLIPGESTNKVTIQLLQSNYSGTVSSGKNGTVALSNGTKIEFDGQFEDSYGNSYSGEVKVCMTLLSSSDKDIITKMPGMLYGEREDGSESLLETYGMVSVALYGSSYQIIQPAKGHKAKFTIPIDPSQTSNAPSGIPLWHFDENYGYWIEEGSANKVGNSYIGEVSHFTWWNADIPETVTTLNVTVTDINSNPLMGILLEIERKSTVRTMGYEITDDKGFASGLVPQNEIMTLKIMNKCGDEIYSKSIGPFTDEATLATIKLKDSKIMKLQGSLKNCKGESVKDGYVKFVESGRNPIFISIANGDINSTVPFCKSGDYSIEGFDIENLKSTNVISGKINEFITDFGILTACNSYTDFISYSLDGGPTRFYTNFLTCSDEPEGFTISYKNGSDWFRVSGWTKESKTNGMHGLLDISFGAPDIKISPAHMNVISYLNYGKSKGDYIDIDFSGTFADFDDISHIQSLKGTVHIRRDN